MIGPLKKFYPRFELVPEGGIPTSCNYLYLIRSDFYFSSFQEIYFPLNEKIDESQVIEGVKVQGLSHFLQYLDDHLIGDENQTEKFFKDGEDDLQRILYHVQLCSKDFMRHGQEFFESQNSFERKDIFVPENSVISAKDYRAIYEGLYDSDLARFDTYDINKFREDCSCPEIFKEGIFSKIETMGKFEKKEDFDLKDDDLVFFKMHDGTRIKNPEIISPKHHIYVVN